jgi:hypothetical protein
LDLAVKIVRPEQSKFDYLFSAIMPNFLGT